ncbi:MAG: GMC family oxidoreductase [Catalinimonas sp.]
MNLNLKATAENTYDAIVVGSGISGGWAAKELTEKGLKVLMLDRGHNLEHIKGYETAMKRPWEIKHRGRLTLEQKRTHPFLTREYPYQETNASYWFNDLDHEYTEEQRFDWIRPNIVGGRSIMWGRQSYRFSPMDFEANHKEGIGVDWPIRYEDLAPWYDYVEQHAGISGSRDGLPQLPDGQFLPPMEMNCVEREVKKGIEGNFGGRKMIIGRVANLTRSHNGRAQCQYRNHCSRGCPYGAYFSTQSGTLPWAVKTGNLTLRPHSIASEILYDKDRKRATGVRVIDAQTQETIDFAARIVFVNASTVWSAYLLLNSRSDAFPNGLGNDHDQVGRNLMDHHFRVGAYGDWEGFEDQHYYGRRANGIYIPRFRNVGDDKREYLRGFGYQGGASRKNWQAAVAEIDFGAELKTAAATPGPWRFGCVSFGECLPYADNRMYLNRDKLDKWGMPTVAFDVGFKENERLMRKDMATDAAEMLEAAGMKNVGTYDQGSYPGASIHEMGTARMGRDPKTSVLNAHNQVWEVPNVFVTDGAAMASSGCQNPSLTYMALTARAADYAVRELNRQNL